MSATVQGLNSGINKHLNDVAASGFENERLGSENDDDSTPSDRGGSHQLPRFR